MTKKREAQTLPLTKDKLKAAMGDDVWEGLRAYLLDVARRPMAKPPRAPNAQSAQRAMAEGLVLRVIQGEIGPNEIAFVRLAFLAIYRAATIELSGEERKKRAEAVHRATGLAGHPPHRVGELVEALHSVAELCCNSALAAQIFDEALKIDGGRVQMKNELHEAMRASLAHSVDDFRKPSRSGADLSDQDDIKRQVRRELSRRRSGPK